MLHKVWTFKNVYVYICTYKHDKWHNTITPPIIFTPGTSYKTNLDLHEDETDHDVEVIPSAPVPVTDNTLVFFDLETTGIGGNHFRVIVQWFVDFMIQTMYNNGFVLHVHYTCQYISVIWQCTSLLSTWLLMCSVNRFHYSWCFIHISLEHCCVSFQQGHLTSSRSPPSAGDATFARYVLPTQPINPKASEVTETLQHQDVSETLSQGEITSFVSL